MLLFWFKIKIFYVLLITYLRNINNKMKPKSIIDISIVIVNYRGWTVLEECLISLQKIKPSNLTFEVIIVDNFSNDGQLKLFKSKFSEFYFYENRGNYGFANGCNVGSNIAIGNHFLFLNPDTKVTDEALVNLLNTYLHHPEIAVLSCLQMDENDKLYDQNKLFPSFIGFFGISRFIYKKTILRQL